ncbi:hypothetical protein RRG08_055573 [Elysia crispata]|uniref:Uncharacterized protein n=1 Tax=Elysia crispata TaxID=231223 RepID=A0AAE0ZRT6_9GAST|nr:hypothetical protein RRG08_055573 [Elysia crispata]
MAMAGWDRSRSSSRCVFEVEFHLAKLTFRGISVRPRWGGYGTITGCYCLLTLCRRLIFAFGLMFSGLPVFFDHRLSPVVENNIAHRAEEFALRNTQ